ncbi:Solute carrier family 15 member 2 [Geodia barretti]|nr:Solute carrier family 15 member 2 [Geodia barretti]
MNGELGTVAVKPDQMQALNPILILVFIPIFEFGVYPLAAKCRLLKRPLQRMVVGMVIAGLSFMVAGFVQISVQNADTSISSGHAKIVVINSSPDTLNTRLFDQNFNLSSAETFSRTVGHLSNQTLCVTSDLSAEDPCSSGSSLNFSLSSQHIVQLVVYNDDGELGITMISEKESLPDGGKSSFRVINTVVPESYVNFTLYSKRCNCSLESCGSEVLTQHIPFQPSLTQCKWTPRGTTIVQDQHQGKIVTLSSFRLAEYTLLFWGTLTMKSIQPVWWSYMPQTLSVCSSKSQCTSSLLWARSSSPSLD